MFQPRTSKARQYSDSSRPTAASCNSGSGALTACSPASTDLEARLGHTFKNRDLLKRALTHASANANASNERLEFLGDRVLALVAAENLFALYPEDAEGALALKFNALARREACARAAETAGLADHLILANSEA